MAASCGLFSYIPHTHQGKGMLSALNADAVLCVVPSPLETAYTLPAISLFSVFSLLSAAGGGDL